MPRFTLARTLAYGFVSLWSVAVLLPLLWMVLASFKTRREMFMDPTGLPADWTLDAYGRAWKAGMGQYLLNSLLVTAASVGVIVMVSGMAAYVFARSDLRGVRWLYLLVVAAFAVPAQAVLVPLYQMVSAAGMLNSLWAIVLPYAAYGIPFTTILFYAFFLDFPRELEEAARLDGCSRIRVFFSVVLPLSGPAVASAAIFQAVFTWNEFILALMMLTAKGVKTLPVGVMQLRGEYTADWPGMLAGLTIAVLPMLVIFVLAQKYFVRSLAGLGK
ncbi:MAG: carbohydrate ABC transporter permease [Rhodobacteraceae bacterium]|jgi:multiple sugar transport system permease protein/raffinose/stachyose/melibiose transport system permease protein|nr:carbohydrate ABC transporter permease [Paracoccaceae bacterium]